MQSVDIFVAAYLVGVMVVLAVLSVIAYIKVQKREKNAPAEANKD